MWRNEGARQGKRPSEKHDQSCNLGAHVPEIQSLTSRVSHDIMRESCAPSLYLFTESGISFPCRFTLAFDRGPGHGPLPSLPSKVMRRSCAPLYGTVFSRLLPQISVNNGSPYPVLKYSLSHAPPPSPPSAPAPFAVLRGTRFFRIGFWRLMHLYNVFALTHTVNYIDIA